MNRRITEVGTLLLAVILTSGAAFGQQPRVGKPFGNTLNFFSTQNVGSTLAHSQSGVFGNVNDGIARWISIGRPSGVQEEVYGMRIQDRGHVTTLSLNGTSNDKDLELQWGGPSFPLLKFNYLLSPTSLREVMSLNGNGRLIVAPENVGSGSDPNIINLFVRGSASLTGSLFQNSDRRLKENIVPLRSNIIEDESPSLVTQRLLKLEGVKYQFRADEEGKDHIGFIAQDVEALFPELVMQDEEGTYSVNYSGLIPVLVEGVKEQQEIMDQQAATIDALNDKVSRLETQMEEVIKALR